MATAIEYDLLGLGDLTAAPSWQTHDRRLVSGMSAIYGNCDGGRIAARQGCRWSGRPHRHDIDGDGCLALPGRPSTSAAEMRKKMPSCAAARSSEDGRDQRAEVGHDAEEDDGRGYYLDALMGYPHTDQNEPVNRCVEERPVSGRWPRQRMPNAIGTSSSGSNFADTHVPAAARMQLMI